jgi:hypothetical protein
LGTGRRYSHTPECIYQIMNTMNIIPSHNSLFKKYVVMIVNEFTSLALKQPESRKIKNIMEYIFQNWNAF